MPNTANFALPYPVTSDAPNVPSHMQALAVAADTALGRGAQLLGVATTGTNVTDTTTNYVTLASVTVTVPSGLPAARRILALGYTQLGIGTVGNVNLVILQSDATTGAIAAGSISPFGGFNSSRASNPTASTSYGNNFWAIGPVPTAGSHTWTLRAANLATGTYTSFFGAIAVLVV